MTKHYKRGNFSNKLKSVYAWFDSSQHINSAYKFKQSYVKTLIVRGIGYRAFALKNDITKAANNINKDFVNYTRPVFTNLELDESQEISQVSRFEFPTAYYLSVRAGHTKDLYLPLHPALRCITSKKDRKLAILCDNKILPANLARTVYVYRRPSVYTGRGVRIKHDRPIRKAGKKDKQKGRAF